MFPDYLSLPADRLGEGQPVTVRIVGDQENLAETMAADILEVIERVEKEGRQPTLILPVGPVDQFPILARTVNQRRISLRHLVIINMDEYLDGNDAWIPADHPLSFRGFMDRKFYDLVDLELAPPMENRVFPHPEKPERIQQLIDDRGGVDACFGGIGINGHMAFNEPPEPGQPVDTGHFAQLPTRSLDLSRETRTINSVTVGGGLELIPRRAVTVGMKEILESRQLRFYCNRPWQRAVSRRVLHGPVTAACPASLMRNHPDARLTLANYAAEPPDIMLR